MMLRHTERSTEILPGESGNLRDRDFVPSQTINRRCPSDPLLPDELNIFYARFEASHSTQAQPLLPTENNQVLHLTTAVVRKALASITPHKAAGPDNIPGCVLKNCAEQLKEVFTDIFNISLKQAVVPTCIKSATIIPVPKRPNPDFRPVALTALMKKGFECLVMQHINKCLPADLDPLQFTYRANRAAEDANSTMLHLSLSQLEQKKTYGTVLFIAAGGKTVAAKGQQQHLQLGL